MEAGRIEDVMARVTRRTTCPQCRAVFRRNLRRCPIDGSILQPLPQDPLVGEIVGDRYHIDHVFADGATARRYVATDERTGERCLVKVMFGDYAGVERYRRRFAREAQIGSRLCHPNVLAVIDNGETRAGIPFLVSVYVEGATLSTIIHDDAPLGRERAVALLADIAEGVAHLHERGFIHRGLTSDAIIVTHFRDSEAAIVADLGIAFADSASTSENMGRLTRAGKVVGTPAYMSPEQTLGGPLDHRSDLYSLGVLLYEMLSGRPPFDGSPIELASQNLAATAPRISARVPNLRVDPTLESIAARLMHKDPDHRFATATELLAALGPGKIARA